MVFNVIQQSNPCRACVYSSSLVAKWWQSGGESKESTCLSASYNVKRPCGIPRGHQKPQRRASPGFYRYSVDYTSVIIKNPKFENDSCCRRGSDNRDRNYHTYLRSNSFTRCCICVASYPAFSSLSMRSLPDPHLPAITSRAIVSTDLRVLH